MNRLTHKLMTRLPMRRLLGHKISWVFFFVFCLTSAQSSAQIKWMTMNEALAAQVQNPKKIFMDVYTDWCGPCSSVTWVEKFKPLTNSFFFAKVAYTIRGFSLKVAMIEIDNFIPHPWLMKA